LSSANAPGMWHKAVVRATVRDPAGGLETVAWRNDATRTGGVHE
jgi:hypothetical protein